MGDGAKIVHNVIVVHPDAIITNGEGFTVGAGNEANMPLVIRNLKFRVRGLLKPRAIEGIGRVRDQLS